MKELIKKPKNILKNKKLLPYYGGKFYLAKELLSYIPPHETYVEVFGGGATLLFIKEPAKLEVYNDIDGNLSNFFLVLAHKFDEFITKLQALPYSDFIRKYYNETLEEGNDVDRAVKIFYILHTNFNGILRPSPGFSRALKSLKAFIHKKLYLPAFYDRIQNVIIENSDFEKIFKYYDKENTFFYLDPPYLLETRLVKQGYKFEMTTEDHIRMLKVILNAKGKVMLSCYDNDLYKEYLKGWNKIEIETVKYSSNKKIKPKIFETVYMNYDITNKQ